MKSHLTIAAVVLMLLSTLSFADTDFDLSASCRGPHYPQKAMDLMQEGRVLITLEINKKGQILAAKIQESSGYPLLDESALAAAKRCKFSSKTANSKLKATKLSIPYTFKI